MANGRAVQEPTRVAYQNWGRRKQQPEQQTNQALLESMAAHFIELEAMQGEWPSAIRTHCEAWDAIMGRALHPTV